MALEYKSIKQSADATLQYILGRRDGSITSLRTGKKKLDSALLDGVEWNKIFTIGGMPGSGKSTIVEEFKRGFVDLNPHEKFKILSFEFEMPASEQFGRNISGKMEVPTRWLYSAEAVKPTDEDIEKIRAVADKLSNYPIYSVDEVGTVDDIVSTIFTFAKEQELEKNGEGLVVTIDHVLLTKGSQGDSEKAIVDELSKKMVIVKKAFVAKGIKIIIILLSQLNRNLETNERKLNPTLHYPTSSDLFGSSSLYYCSDYVMITHKPLSLELSSYGPPRGEYTTGLPVRNPKNPDQAMIYWHLLKHRSGEPKIFMMTDALKYSRIDEF